MRRLATAFLSVSLAGGCVSATPQTDFGGAVGHWGKAQAPSVPGVCGPYGEKVPMAAPYAYAPPSNGWAAQRMMQNSMPMNMMMPNPGMPGPMGGMSPPGLPGMPGMG